MSSAGYRWSCVKGCLQGAHCTQYVQVCQYSLSIARPAKFMTAAADMAAAGMQRHGSDHDAMPWLLLTKYKQRRTLTWIVNSPVL